MGPGTQGMQPRVVRGRRSVDGSWDPVLRELAEPDWLSAVNDGCVTVRSG